MCGTSGQWNSIQLIKRNELLGHGKTWRKFKYILINEETHLKRLYDPNYMTFSRKCKVMETVKKKSMISRD